MLLCGCSWRPCAKSWNAEKTGSNTYKRTSESAIGCSASNSREAFKKSMNHYAVENLFGIEGLNIAWYGIIITFGMILGFMLALRRCKKNGVEPDHLFKVSVFWYATSYAETAAATSSIFSTTRRCSSRGGIGTNRVVIVSVPTLGIFTP